MTGGDQPVSWLMFFTLAAAVFIVAGGFIQFLRSQRNRDIAADTLGGDNSRVGKTPNGAAPELVAGAVAAFAVMGLLATGYAKKPNIETAQKPGPVGGMTTGMAQSPNIQNEPKVYQPVNPAPDTRAAPTGSDTGTGPANGNTGQPR